MLKEFCKPFLRTGFGLTLILLAQSVFAQEKISKWIIPNTVIEEDDTVAAYFLVKADKASDSLQLQLIQSHNAHVYFSGNGHDFHILSIQNLKADSLIGVKMVSFGEKPFKLMCATTQFSSGIKTTSLIESPVISAQDNSWTLSPLIASIVTAVIGFFAGSLSYWLQKYFENNQSEKAKKLDVDISLLKNLLFEITEHRTICDSIVSKTKLAEDILPLPNPGYNTILGEEGLVIATHDNDFKKFFALTKAYYREVNKLNFLINSYEQDKKNQLLFNKIQSKATEVIKNIQDIKQKVETLN
jgi:hypothetical protein